MFQVLEQIANESGTELGKNPELVGVWTINSSNEFTLTPTYLYNQLISGYNQFYLLDKWESIHLHTRDSNISNLSHYPPWN